MAQLIVRNVDPALVRALKLRAVRQGRSAEAEHRELLRKALADAGPARSLKQLLLEVPSVGTQRDFAPPRGKPRRVKL